VPAIAEVNEEGLDLLDVFPNPALGSVTIKVAKPSQVTVLDTKGQAIVDQHVEHSLTINSLTPGLYIVNRNDMSSKSVKKLVIK
jgi:hypothetical protein